MRRTVELGCLLRDSGKSNSGGSVVTTLLILELKVMSSFLHATTKDDGIYYLVMKNPLLTSFHSALWDALSVLL